LVKQVSPIAWINININSNSNGSYSFSFDKDILKMEAVISPNTLEYIANRANVAL
jgi:hypothetical protein